MTRTIVFALAALAIATPAAAEVTETSPDHFVTHDTATVKATTKAAWLALISPREWWDDKHTWSGKAENLTLVPQGGGCFCERLPEQDTATDIGLAGSAQHMTVVMADPMKVLRMRGALGPLQSEPVNGVLTITLQAAKGGGTKIVWEYVVAGHMRYDVAKISKAVDAVMSLQLGHLADMLGRTDGSAVKVEKRAAKSEEPAAEPEKPVDAADDDVGTALDAMGKTAKGATDPER